MAHKLCGAGQPQSIPDSPWHHYEMKEEKKSLQSMKRSEETEWQVVVMGTVSIPTCEFIMLGVIIQLKSKINGADGGGRFVMELEPRRMNTYMHERMLPHTASESNFA